MKKNCLKRITLKKNCLQVPKMVTPPRKNNGPSLITSTLQYKIRLSQSLVGIEQEPALGKDFKTGQSSRIH